MAQSNPIANTRPVPRASKCRRTVRIHVHGGAVLEGTMVVTPGRGIREMLNAASPFVEFKSGTGQRFYLAKTSIHTVQVLYGPEPEQTTRKTARENGKTLH